MARPARAPAARSAGVVYLTFDDGPTLTRTPQVLDLLARYRARATFFVVGRSAATWPGLVRRAYRAGHGVGNVLLHDGGGDRSQTVAALQQVLASLSARGFRFRALCRS